MTVSRLLPEEVADAPELLVLAALDTNLWTLHVSLVAAFPELIDDFPRQRDGPTLRAARRLSDCAARLNIAIARYRRALQLERAPPPDTDDLPF
jgi:hypothetical protein